MSFCAGSGGRVNGEAAGEKGGGSRYSRIAAAVVLSIVPPLGEKYGLIAIR